MNKYQILDMQKTSQKEAPHKPNGTNTIFIEWFTSLPMSKRNEYKKEICRFTKWTPDQFSDRLHRVPVKFSEQIIINSIIKARSGVKIFNTPDMPDKDISIH